MRTQLTVELLGRVGQNSELKKFSNGKIYLSFTVAHNEQWKDANGQPVERTVWVSVLYAQKEDTKLTLEQGTAILLRGTISTTIYKDKNGMQQVGLNLNARELAIIGRIERKGVVSEIPGDVPPTDDLPVTPF